MDTTFQPAHLPPALLDRIAQQLDSAIERLELAVDDTQHLDPLEIGTCTASVADLAQAYNHLSTAAAVNPLTGTSGLVITNAADLITAIADWFAAQPGHLRSDRPFPATHLYRTANDLTELVGAARGERP